VTSITPEFFNLQNTNRFMKLPRKKCLKSYATLTIADLFSIIVRDSMEFDAFSQLI